MKNQVFTTTTLPSGISAVVHEGYGRHYFNAIKKAQGDNSQLAKYLLVELVEVDGKRLTEEDVDNMHMRDIVFAVEVVMSMLTNGIPGLPGL